MERCRREFHEEYVFVWDRTNLLLFIAAVVGTVVARQQIHLLGECFIRFFTSGKFELMTTSAEVLPTTPFMEIYGTVSNQFYDLR